MNRATHQHVSGIGRILLEGVADGRPIRERAWHHKQHVYVDRDHEIRRYVFSDFQDQYAGGVVETELELSDLGFTFPDTRETVVGFRDFVTDDGAPLPFPVTSLQTSGYLSLSTYDSILVESPPSGALSGGASLTSAAVPGDLVLTGTNLTSIAPVTTELMVVDPGAVDGTDAADPKNFGAGQWLFVRNHDWQEWLRVWLEGSLTPAQIVAAINARVAEYAASVGKLRPSNPPRGTWDAGDYPNIFAVTPVPGGAAGTIRLFAHGEASRIEIASEAEVTAVTGGTGANTVLLGAAFAAGSTGTGTGSRGTVTHSDITENVGGTTLTVGVADVPAGTTIGDIVYVNINEFDIFVTITS